MHEIIGKKKPKHCIQSAFCPKQTEINLKT